MILILTIFAILISLVLFGWTMMSIILLLSLVVWKLHKKKVFSYQQHGIWTGVEYERATMQFRKSEEFLDQHWRIPSKRRFLLVVAFSPGCVALGIWIILLVT